jgi:hypothetical protein
MLYDSTKELLWSLVRSLETTDEAAWDDRLELGKECLFEISQMARRSCSSYRTDSANPQWPSHLPDAENALQALPHVKMMMGAIRCRDRAAALESAKTALAAM